MGKESAMPQLVRARSSKRSSVRAQLARQYLAGEGIEIGSLAQPVRAPHLAVRYYDCYTEAELTELYPHLAGRLTALDGISTLESLSEFDASSQDFIIACRVLEY